MQSEGFLKERGVALQIIPPMFMSVGITWLAGAFLLYHVCNLATSGSKVLASRLLHASVLYLPVALGIMAAGKA